MNPLLSAALIWAVLFSAMMLFGICCIKYGVYSSTDGEYKPLLEL